MSKTKPHPIDASAEPITARPPFDPVQFARDSESAIRVSEQPASMRPTMRPPLEADPLTGPAYDPGSIPALAATRESLARFDLSPLARALLEHVNGCTQLDAICRSAGASPDEVARAFEHLALRGIIVWR